MSLPCRRCAVGSDAPRSPLVFANKVSSWMVGYTQTMLLLCSKNKVSPSDPRMHLNTASALSTINGEDVNPKLRHRIMGVPRYTNAESKNEKRCSEEFV